MIHISHETIYKGLYVQARGDRGTIRIVNGVPISKRPEEIEGAATMQVSFRPFGYGLWMTILKADNERAIKPGNSTC